MNHLDLMLDDGWNDWPGVGGVDGYVAPVLTPEQQAALDDWLSHESVRQDDERRVARNVEGRSVKTWACSLLSSCGDVRYVEGGVQEGQGGPIWQFA